MKRISTGSAELDFVLGGGFPENSVNLVMGLPGTGKTVLAEKLIFTNATPERPALYLGTVSEPLDKMLRYLQEFDYFDPDLIGESVIYQDLSGALRTGGLQGISDEIFRLVKEHRPSLLVIDSFKALHSFSDSSREFRQQLSALLTGLSALAITSFLVGEYRSEEASTSPEFAIADSVIELVLQKSGVKDARYVRVIKERGSDFFGGEHAFKITSSGLEVFTRLVTPRHTIDYELSSRRERTGVDILDAMVEDGFFKGSSTVVFGPPGSGKTLLGLHYMFKGIEMGEKGLIATLQENPTQLQRIAGAFGWDIQGAIDSGMLALMYVSPVDVYLDEFVAKVNAIAAERGVERVMIDSLNDLEASAPNELRFRDFMYSLVQRLSTRGISLYMTSEITSLFSATIQTKFGISHMSDNVILTHYVRDKSEIKRAISVIKTRASHHEPGIREFTITSEGIKIEAMFGPDMEFTDA